MDRMSDEGFAVGNDAIVDEVCSPDLVEHQFGLAGDGAEAIAYVKAGDRVWVRVRGRGTNTGAFFGPPSNRPVDILVFDQARVVDGRIVEHWGARQVRAARPDRSAHAMG